VHSPSPALVSVGAVDVGDGQGEQAAEGAGNGIAHHEHVEAPLQFVARVVVAEEEDGAGDESGLEDSDHEAHCDNAGPVGDHTLTNCENT